MRVVFRGRDDRCVKMLVWLKRFMKIGSSVAYLGVFQPLWTERIEGTLVTLGPLTLADIPPVEQQPVMGRGHFFGRDMAQELLLHLQWGIGRGRHQGQPMADTINMCIDCEGRLAKPYGLHHIGGLVSHTGQPLEQGTVGGHFATEIGHEHAGHLDQMACLGIGIGHALDVEKHVVGLGCGHRGGIGVMAEEFGSDHIDPLVGALGTEQRGDKQLESAGELKFCRDHRLLLAEIGQHGGISFLTCHREKFSRIVGAKLAKKTDMACF